MSKVSNYTGRIQESGSFYRCSLRLCSNQWKSVHFKCVNPTSMAVINAVHLIRIFYPPQYTDKAQLVITAYKISANYMNPLKYSKAVSCTETLRCPHKFLNISLTKI